MRRVPVPAAIAALALLVACDGPRPPACPGDAVATLRFSGQPAPPSSGDACPFAGDGGVTFTATVAFSGESAVLCPARPEAQPLGGAHDGDHVIVGAPATSAYVSSCACALDVTEVLEGDVVRSGGMAVGFTGQLRDVIAPTGGGGASCEPDGGIPDAGPRCGVPCQLTWQVTATR